VSRHAWSSVPRHVRLGFVVCLFLTSLLMPTAALAADTASVSEELNLRSGPGISYAILTVMPAGSPVKITGEAFEGWYPVRYNDLNGWAYAEYIAIGAPATAAAATSGGAGVQGTATVVTNLLNMRSGPGTSYSVVAQLPYGTTVQITGDPKAGDGRTWVEVMAKGFGQGWVAAEYLDAGDTPATESAPAPAASPAPPASSGDPIIDIITVAANKYGQSPSAMIAVARCESHLDPNAVNRSSGASGLFQFLPGTFRSTPYASYSIFDPWANANAAGWMWSVGRRGEWVC
jgi:uncharacterized protein YraI